MSVASLEINSSEYTQSDPEEQPGSVYERVSSYIDLQPPTILMLSEVDLEEIKSAFYNKGFTYDFGEGSVTGGPCGESGDLHHDEEGAWRVHITDQGSGSANFYWRDYSSIPAKHASMNEEEQEWYFPYEEFDPAIDPVLHSELNVRIQPGSVIVFPAGIWHQFGADPNTTRHSGIQIWEPKTTLHSVKRTLHQMNWLHLCVS